MVIPFNIWDDFFDDGFVPQGKKQETFGYIEEYETLSDEDKSNITDFIFNFLNRLPLKCSIDTEYRSGNKIIVFENITHQELDLLMGILKSSGLDYKGIPIKFYSES